MSERQSGPPDWALPGWDAVDPEEPVAVGPGGAGPPARAVRPSPRRPPARSACGSSRSARSPVRSGTRSARIRGCSTCGSRARSAASRYRAPATPTSRSRTSATSSSACGSATTAAARRSRPRPGCGSSSTAGSTCTSRPARCSSTSTRSSRRASATSRCGSRRSRPGSLPRGCSRPPGSGRCRRRPRTIAVITSPSGAVWRDISHVLARRWPLVQVVLVAAQVQGDGAPASIVTAFRRVGAVRRRDARGGPAGRCPGTDDPGPRRRVARGPVGVQRRTRRPGGRRAPAARRVRGRPRGRRDARRLRGRRPSADPVRGRGDRRPGPARDGGRPASCRGPPGDRHGTSSCHGRSRSGRRAARAGSRQPRGPAWLLGANRSGSCSIERPARSRRASAGSGCDSLQHRRHYRVIQRRGSPLPARPSRRRRQRSRSSARTRPSSAVTRSSAARRMARSCAILPTHPADRRSASAWPAARSPPPSTTARPTDEPGPHRVRIRGRAVRGRSGSSSVCWSHRDSAGLPSASMRMPVTGPTDTRPQASDEPARPTADLSFDDALAELQRTIAELEIGEPAARTDACPPRAGRPRCSSTARRYCAARNCGCANWCRRAAASTPSR